ncbi:MAG: hypothetical protein HZB65_00205 [Candidatus Aenigmarchaeota archaeon]|nr:hypothetical protein [Candidatus Aenigmarchaeota archaeon]
MREVFLVSGDKKQKAEDLLKKDDITMRQSIVTRMCSSLGFEEDGFFIIISGSDDAVKRAKELLKELALPYKNKEKVLKRNDEIEDQATSGFGFIFENK